MADVYESLLNNPLGRSLLSSLNLPIPTELDRHSQTEPSFISGNVLIDGTPGSRMTESIIQTLKLSQAIVQLPSQSKTGDTTLKLCDKHDVSITSVDTATTDARFKGLIFDATGIENSEQTRSLYDFFHPVIRKLSPNSRVVIIGLPPESCKSNPHQHIAQRSLEGFVRSITKEIGRNGSTANLVYVAKQAEKTAQATLRFFLSAKSAFIDGQVVRVNKAKSINADFNWLQPLKDKVALVTGAARGIGEAIADVLTRDGAHVICLDIPQAEDELKTVADRLKGTPLALDITDINASDTIATMLKEKFDGVDIVIHNAGVTRDKTLAGMPAPFWDLVLDVNLIAQENINDALLSQSLIRSGGRIVSVSSTSGIAGNYGQSNYALTKAGVIGMVDAFAPILAKQDITINAVAPGFIETQMTSTIPFATREAGRRLSSLKQGGQPVDVAEAIAFFASPANPGVNGNTLRVCGQSLIGA